MNIEFKVIKIGNVIITTKKRIANNIITLEPKEVWELFERAVKEGKITFGEQKWHPTKTKRLLIK